MAVCHASVVTDFHGPLRVEQVPLPDLEPGAALVRVDAATLCGTDVHIWHGQLPGLQGRAPYIPGHETAGTIEELRGERWDMLGDPLERGARVLWTYPRCGHCYYCRVTHQPTLCPGGISFGRNRADQPPYLLGGCAEYHYVPPGSDIVRIPDNVSSPLAASAACAFRTVMHAYERLGTIASHETVVVQGAGPVGLYATAVARDRGAAHVYVIGAPAVRLDIARAFGADDTLDLDAVPEARDRAQWVLERTAGRGADLVVQAAGTMAIPEGLDLVRPGGRFLSIGGGGGRQLAVNSMNLSLKQIQVTGVRSGEDRHYYQALRFLASRTHIPFERMLTGTFPLERTEEALRGMLALTEIKPVIQPRRDA